MKICQHHVFLMSFAAFVVSSTPLHARTYVHKVFITKTQRLLLAAGNLGDPWRQGEPVCAIHAGKTAACGKVIKSKGQGAIVQIDKVTDSRVAIQAGDEIRRMTRGLTSEAPQSGTVPSTLSSAPAGEAGSQKTSASQSSPSSASQRFNEYGVHGGLSVASLANLPSTIPESGYTLLVNSYQQTNGLFVGFDFKYALNSALSFQTELNFVERGTSFSGSVLGQTYQSVLNLHYLEIPFMLRADLDLRILRPFLLLGPNLAFSMVPTSVTTISGTTTDVAMSGLNTFDFGFYGGGGIAIPLGRLSINLQSRYYYGITNVFQSGGKNRDIAFLVGLSLRGN